jgi:diketogulonate reductase-like aldo/keto reductase
MVRKGVIAMTKFLGFGTSRLRKDEDKDIELLRYAIQCGYNVLDTAENYLDGYSETVIQKALEGIDRKKVIIISKVSPEHLSYKNVLKSALASIKRLGTYIDYYLIHVPNKNIPVTETFRAMEFLKKAHSIKHFGVSNVPYADLLKMEALGISAVEDELNLSYQHNVSTLLWCRKRNIPFFAYMPLSNKWLLSGANKDNFKGFCDKHGKTEAQIALRWIVQKGAIPIVGSTDKAHIRENSQLDFTLSREDMESLQKKQWIPLG